MYTRNKIIIGVALVLILGISFVFRSKVSDWLSFGSPPTMLAPESGKPLAGKVEPESKKDVSLKLPSPVYTESRPPALKVPVYSGRDPAEVRPVPEEVKLFTEAQKEQLYAALKTHAQAVKADPQYFNGWIQIGLLKKTIGDFEGARDSWEYAGLIEPLNSLSFANLGELYWRYLRDYPKSEVNFKISIKNKPSDIGTYVSLADLYHYSYKEKYDSAPGVLLGALKENPREDTLMRHLAYIYELRKDFPNAVIWWKKVLEQNPEDQEVKDKIVKLTAKMEGGGS